MPPTTVPLTKTLVTTDFASIEAAKRATLDLPATVPVTVTLVIVVPNATPTSPAADSLLVLILTSFKFTLEIVAFCVYPNKPAYAIKLPESVEPVDFKLDIV